MMRLLPILMLCVFVSVGACNADDEQLSPVAEALANFTIPPAWVADVEVTFDMNKPWSEARREIRPMLFRGAESARQAMKLTWLYKQKGDIGDGTEYANNMFHGGEALWALANYADVLNARLEAGNTKGLSWMVLRYASCCNRFRDYELSLTALNQAYDFLPDPPKDQFALAQLEEAIGDTYALMGNGPVATEHFAKAAAIYPELTENWIVKNLATHLSRLQTKTDKASLESLDLAGLTDGVHVGNIRGFEGNVMATVTVLNGQVSDIQIEHRESLPQNAPEFIPQQVIEKQSLAVDTVTGATVTSQAIIHAIFRALSQAGLQ